MNIPGEAQAVLGLHLLFHQSYPISLSKGFHAGLRQRNGFCPQVSCKSSGWGRFRFLFSSGTLWIHTDIDVLLPFFFFMCFYCPLTLEQRFMVENYVLLKYFSIEELQVVGNNYELFKFDMSIFWGYNREGFEWSDGLLPDHGLGYCGKCVYVSSHLPCTQFYGIHTVLIFTLERKKIRQRVKATCPMSHALWREELTTCSLIPKPGLVCLGLCWGNSCEVGFCLGTH